MTVSAANPCCYQQLYEIWLYQQICLDNSRCCRQIHCVCSKSTASLFVFFRMHHAWRRDVYVFAYVARNFVGGDRLYGNYCLRLQIFKIAVTVTLDFRSNAFDHKSAGRRLLTECLEDRPKFFTLNSSIGPSNRKFKRYVRVVN
jgi:hypothetical protein